MSRSERAEQTPKESLESKEKEGCIFCEIKNGLQPSIKIAESEKAISFMSLEGHPLVTPKAHVADDLADNIEDVAAAFILASELIPFVKDAYEASGVNIVANIGRSAGQEVDHFHVHLLPRKEGDNGPKLKVVNTPKRKEFSAIAVQIGRGFENLRKIPTPSQR